MDRMMQVYQESELSENQQYVQNKDIDNQIALQHDQYVKGNAEVSDRKMSKVLVLLLSYSCEASARSILRQNQGSQDCDHYANATGTAEHKPD